MDFPQYIWMVEYAGFYMEKILYSNLYTAKIV